MSLHRDADVEGSCGKAPSCSTGNENTAESACTCAQEQEHRPEAGSRRAHIPKHTVGVPQIGHLQPERSHPTGRARRACAGGMHNRALAAGVASAEPDKGACAGGLLGCGTRWGLRCHRAVLPSWHCRICIPGSLPALQDVDGSRCSSCCRMCVLRSLPALRSVHSRRCSWCCLWCINSRTALGHLS